MGPVSASESVPHPSGESRAEPATGRGDTPMALSLGGFLAGCGYVVVVPGVMVSVGHALWPEYAGPGLTFTALVTLGVPLGLLVPARTRRFGTFMLVGLAVTLLVVAALVGVVWMLLNSGTS